MCNKNPPPVSPRFLPKRRMDFRSQGHVTSHEITRCFDLPRNVKLLGRCHFFGSTLQFHKTVSSSYHFRTKATPFQSHKSVSSSQIRQLQKNRLFSHTSVISTQIGQFHTNPSVPHKSASFRQIAQFHSNRSIPHESVSSALHFHTKKPKTNKKAKKTDGFL